MRKNRSRFMQMAFVLTLQGAVLALSLAGGCSSRAVVTNSDGGGGNGGNGGSGGNGSVSATSLCGDLCDCTGCPPSELEACVTALEYEQSQAEDAGCTNEYDDVLGCFADSLECSGGEVNVNGCDTQKNALEDCLGGTQECPYTNDGYCDEPDLCPPGTDTADCNGTTTSCSDCACLYLQSDNPPGCADICDYDISGASSPNFCNGVTALSQCEACIQETCGLPSSECY